jgi:hypothetical protein
LTLQGFLLAGNGVLAYGEGMGEPTPATFGGVSLQAVPRTPAERTVQLLAFAEWYALHPPEGFGRHHRDCVVAELSGRAPPSLFDYA